MTPRPCVSENSLPCHKRVLQRENQVKHSFQYPRSTQSPLKTVGLSVAWTHVDFTTVCSMEGQSPHSSTPFVLDNHQMPVSHASHAQIDPRQSQLLNQQQQQMFSMLLQAQPGPPAFLLTGHPSSQVNFFAGSSTLPAMLPGSTTAAASSHYLHASEQYQHRWGRRQPSTILTCPRATAAATCSCCTANPAGTASAATSSATALA